MSNETASPKRAIDWAKIIETALTAPGNVGNTYNRASNSYSEAISVSSSITNHRQAGNSTGHLF